MAGHFTLLFHLQHITESPRFDISVRFYSSTIIIKGDQDSKIRHSSLITTKILSTTAASAIMAHKRKRSSSDFESSPSSTSSTISLPASFHMADMDSPPNPFAAFSRHNPPSHLNSRTMKRHRDSRPSDEQVHRKFYEWRAHHRHQSRDKSSCVPAERTLGLLYSAQHSTAQQLHQHRQPPSPTPTSQWGGSSSGNAQMSTTMANEGGCNSLHRFWNISSAPVTTMPLPIVMDSQLSSPSDCEDCGAANGEGMDYGMEMSGCGIESNSPCGACGKHVCYSCSVSNLGEEKRCLQCAGRKVWIGGIGWTNAGVQAC